MGTLMHVGRMFQALDSDQAPGEARRWLEINSWSKRVFIRIGKNPDEDYPEDSVGVTLTEPEAVEVLGALQEAMRQAGHKV